jgi:hypothetical protein
VAVMIKIIINNNNIAFFSKKSQDKNKHANQKSA